MCTCLTERQSPDLIIASRNGLRAISLWAAAWTTTTLLHIVVRKVTGQTAFDFVVSSSSLLLCTVQYSQYLVTATSVGSFSNLFSLPTALIGLTSTALCPRTRHLSTVCNTYLYVSQEHPSARIQSFALHRCLTFTSRWNIHV